MTNTDIVNIVYQQHINNMYIFVNRNVYHKQYAEDILQEMWVKLLTVDNNILNCHYNNNTILFYMKKMILNMFNKPTSNYHKYIRMKNDYIDYTHIDIPDDIYNDEYYKKYEYISSYNYEIDFFTKLFKYYICGNVNREKKTMKEISQDLNISKFYINKNFDIVKQKIREKYDTE